MKLRPFVSPIHGLVGLLILSGAGLVFIAAVSPQELAPVGVKPHVLPEGRLRRGVAAGRPQDPMAAYRWIGNLPAPRRRGCSCGP